MRRVLVLLLTTGMLGAGVAAADAKPSSKAPRLHAFRSCTNLLGYAQRASNDWAALGQAVPDWMHDYTANLVKGSSSNYIRWMHVTPQRVDVASADKYGIINIAPAGDKEADVTGVQWTQRTNVMRATCPTGTWRVW